MTPGELQVKGMTNPGKKVEEVEAAEEQVDQLVTGEIETILDDPDAVAKSPVKIDVVRENFECDKCGKNYGTKGSLRTHKYNHIKKEMAEEPKDVKEMVDNSEEVTIVDNIGNTREEKEKFHCEQCGKTYGTKGSLRTHKYIHIKRELKLEDALDNRNQCEDPQQEKNGLKADEKDKRQTFEEKMI